MEAFISGLLLRNPPGACPERKGTAGKFILKPFLQRGEGS